MTTLLDAIRAAGYLVTREDGAPLRRDDVARLDELVLRYSRNARAAKTEAPKETP
jgi:hypothetical protein